MKKTTHHRVAENAEDTRRLNSLSILCVLRDSVVNPDSPDTQPQIELLLYPGGCRTCL